MNPQLAGAVNTTKGDAMSTEPTRRAEMAAAIERQEAAEDEYERRLEELGLPDERDYVRIPPPAGASHVTRADDKEET